MKGILVSLVVVTLVSSCTMKTKTLEPYRINIDSLSAPDTVNARTIFDVKIFGYVGPSKCYAYEKVYIYTTTLNEIVIEAWGKYTYVGDPCADEIVMLNQTVETSVSTPGVYTIKALNSNLGYLTKTLVAK